MAQNLIELTGKHSSSNTPLGPEGSDQNPITPAPNSSSFSSLLPKIVHRKAAFSSSSVYDVLDSVLCSGLSPNATAILDFAEYVVGLGRIILLLLRRVCRRLSP